jgi:hypothetical protein
MVKNTHHLLLKYLFLSNLLNTVTAKNNIVVVAVAMHSQLVLSRSTTTWQQNGGCYSFSHALSVAAFTDLMYYCTLYRN